MRLRACRLVKKKKLTNQKTSTLKEIEIDGMHVEMLPPEGKVKYVGQMVTFMGQESTEVQHRIRCAWSAFARTDNPVLLTTTQVTPL